RGGELRRLPHRQARRRRRDRHRSHGQGRHGDHCGATLAFARRRHRRRGRRHAGHRGTGTHRRDAGVAGPPRHRSPGRGAAGRCVPVTAAVPRWPPTVGPTLPRPWAPPATWPLGLTAATLGSRVAHVTVRPVSATRAESCGVAVSCTVCPTATLAVAGETVTEATGTVVTVIAAVLLLPSLVAAMVAEPWATPVTWPLGLTVATLGLL